jgi:hypothetical protein
MCVLEDEMKDVDQHSPVTAWRSFSFHLLFNQLQLIDEREDVLKEK